MLFRSAVERAVEIAKAIPYPTDTVEIKNWSGLHYASWECYSGYSYYFYGSNLSHSEVIQSYREYFEQKGWAVYEESSNERDLSVWEEGEIAGFDINVTLCDSVVECADSTSSQEDQDIIKIALQQYTTTFWLKVFYKPESIRGNLCGCCGA